MEGEIDLISIQVDQVKQDKVKNERIKIKIHTNTKCSDKWNHLEDNIRYKEEFQKLWVLFLQDPRYKWWSYISSFIGFFFYWFIHKDGHFWKEIESLASVLQVNPNHLYYFQFWIEINYNIIIYHSKEERSLTVVDWEGESHAPNFIILEIYDDNVLMARGYTLAGCVGIFHGYIDAVYYCNIQSQKRASIPGAFSIKRNPSLCFGLRKAIEAYTSVENFCQHFSQSPSWIPFYLYVYNASKKQKVLIEKNGTLEDCLFFPKIQSLYHSGYLKTIRNDDFKVTEPNQRSNVDWKIYWETKRVQQLTWLQKEDVDGTISLFSLADKTGMIKSRMILSIEMNLKNLEESIVPGFDQK